MIKYCFLLTPLTTCTVTTQDLVLGLDYLLLCVLGLDVLAILHSLLDEVVEGFAEWEERYMMVSSCGQCYSPRGRSRTLVRFISFMLSYNMVYGSSC
jgi:hypothetical protein